MDRLFYEEHIGVTNNGKDTTIEIISDNNEQRRLSTFLGNLLLLLSSDEREREDSTWYDH